MIIKNKEKMNIALARVNGINWKQSDSNAREGSQIALMREFLRRIALLKAVVQLEFHAYFHFGVLK